MVKWSCECPACGNRRQFTRKHHIKNLWSCLNDERDLFEMGCYYEKSGSCWNFTLTRILLSSLPSSLAASDHTPQSYMGELNGGLVEVAHI